MNTKWIYATPSRLDRASSAFDFAVSEFSSGLWIPFAAILALGIGLFLVGHAEETQGWAELYATGGQAALDGYFATVHAAHLSIQQLMFDALSGHSVLIGGVLQGWGIFIAFAVMPLAFLASLAGVTITAYIKQGRRYRLR